MMMTSTRWLRSTRWPFVVQSLPGRIVKHESTNQHEEEDWAVEVPLKRLGIHRVGRQERRPEDQQQERGA